MKTALTLVAALPLVASAQLLVRPYSQTNEALETRVRRDFASATDAPFVHYAAPAMSDRQRLPDVYPDDGVAGGKVTILAAKGEYEPGGFLVYPFRDLGKTELKLSPLVTKDGQTFPADKLDLAVVKVWYQNGNGWYSYFGDCGKKLCPEMLLHDEDLIRVDVKEQANYARIRKDDGTTTEKWINPPRQMDELDPHNRRSPRAFRPMKPGFADAKTLQPVDLKKGEFKSFILTAHVTPDIPAGLYVGSIQLKHSNTQTTQTTQTTLGSIPVELRVLDFELPKYPGTYADPTREFMTANYGYISMDLIMKENGGDEKLARRQFVEVCRNLVSHNQSLLKIRSEGGAEFEEVIDITREAGMRRDLYMGGVRPPRFTHPDERREELDAHARRLVRVLDRKLGHHNIILSYGDEPGQQWIVDNRPVFEIYQKYGFKFLIAGSDNLFVRAGHFFDWHNIAKDPANDSTTRLWNQMADKPIVAWYSTMHVGPENPAFNRRQYGMAPYLAGYGAVCNYAHHFGPYNDDTTTYRPMVFAYGTADGVIDTLAWEGFREGIDDMRYATVLVTYARAAVATKRRDGRILGNSALHFLASFDRAAGDLDFCRAEMVDRILKLKKFLKESVPAVVVKAPAFDMDPTVSAAKKEGETDDETVPGGARRFGADDFCDWEKILATFKPRNYKTFYLYALAQAATGRRGEAIATLKGCLGNKRLKLNPEEREIFEVIVSLLEGKTVDFADKRVIALDRAGGFFNALGDEKMLKELAAKRPPLPALVDKKRYVVHYSEKPIGSGRDMDDRAIEAQSFTRKFGTQSMQFMTTDVATGDRGNAAAATEGAKPSELRVVADDWGLHVRLDAFDPRAKEFAAGLQDFGSFESYLAPGANQPYTCFVQRLRNPGRTSVFNTNYSTTGHRRIDLDDANNCREEVYFTEEGACAYLALSWNNFATLVPAKGAVWDFESVNWGPNKAAWNGTESIHGRSTWGQLVFELSDAARLKILRRQIHLAVRAFREESMAQAGTLGAVRFWTDPELGDTVFYYREVKPLVDRLEEAAKRATADMDDATVKDLAENYLADWREIRYTLQRLRTRFLELRIKDQLGDEPADAPLPWKAKAICIDPPSTTNVARFCDFITKDLGPGGFGTLVLRVRYRYQFESHPDCRGTDPLSKADLARIAAACRAAGVKLVPKINLLSHQEGLDDGTVKEGILKAHPEFDESRGRGGKVRSQKRHTICPSEPEARKIALDLALELAAACGADAFHLGCDEVLDFAQCEKCRAVTTKWSGKGNSQLFADWVNALARGLKEKGISSMIWADRLASCDITRMDPFQSSDNGLWKSLPLLDKDIVLCDWHYWPNEGYPSVDILQEAGFTTWLSIWNGKRASKVFLDYGKKHDRGRIAGVMFTSWYGADRFLAVLDGRSLPEVSDPEDRTAAKVAGEVEVYRWLKGL